MRNIDNMRNKDHTDIYEAYTVHIDTIDKKDKIRIDIYNR